MTQGQSGLTLVQSRVLKYVATHIARHQAPPTYREIAKHCQLGSTGRVKRVLDNLAERGHITKDKRRARSIAIVKHTCPHCGGDLS